MCGKLTERAGFLCIYSLLSSSTAHFCLSTEQVCDALWKKENHESTNYWSVLLFCHSSRQNKVPSAGDKLGMKKHRWRFDLSRLALTSNLPKQVYFTSDPCLVAKLHIKQKLQADERITACLWATAIKQEGEEVKELSCAKVESREKSGVGGGTRH